MREKQQKPTEYKNSKFGAKIITRWLFESAIIMRPASSQHTPDGRENSTKSSLLCPIIFTHRGPIFASNTNTR